ncbi:hypothetical protein [Pelagovum pacificum]|uniref:Uncharacterized protein n=1 Tax=Pelagovum pacificum TaxID=2588711 RepID=A0A5C5GC67_9RHOB|nr:hypothetical protein [Pelagovum pacificum]QQA44493.1 hypothetical protein I8N54_07965 [Pelagovum pacificum]TNY32392.1 hypothetical protein FHY64_03610 [Pelagovum pacificum]
MAISFQILADRGLVYVRYGDHVNFGETLEAFGRYAAHPDFAPGQRQLVDLSRVTSFENNYPELLKLQARKLDDFAQQGIQTLLVYYAPTDISFDMARLVRRSWDGLEGVVIRVAQTEEQALEMIGERERSMADLLMQPGNR